MNNVTGSPKPDIACPVVSSPVAHRATAVPIATISTGMRFQMNSTTTTPSKSRLTVESLTAADPTSRRPVVLDELSDDQVQDDPRAVLRDDAGLRIRCGCVCESLN